MFPFDLTPVLTQTNPEPPEMDLISVFIEDIVLSVEVAATATEREAGLSGKQELPSGVGTLFLFSSSGSANIWMKGMNFELDLIWIGDRCKVVDIDENVPLPNESEEIITIYRSTAQAEAVIEVLAGSVQELGIRRGSSVLYGPSPLGRFYGCDG